MDNALAGDYIAWHLALHDPAAAFDLGLAMLPPLDAPPAVRVYNDNERSTGAMLLALAAATPKQRWAAVQRIESRRLGGPLGGEDLPPVAAAYRAALAVLGTQDQRRMLDALLTTAILPRRRRTTALLAAGHRRAFDRLLWAGSHENHELADLLISQGLDEVLAATAPDLPTLDAAASDDLRAWQIRFIQDHYAIHRRTIRLGLRR
jgi:hypothetical protein